MAGTGCLAGGAGQAGDSLPNTEVASALLIRARQAHDDVKADPDTYRPVAEALVSEARTAREPEALALALRALAAAERAQLDARSALRLLDEACRIARRHRLTDTLADLLMTRADVGQELGRLTAAGHDLRAAEALVTGDRALELAFHRAVLLQNSGRLPDAAVIYRRLLPDPAIDPRHWTLCANNLALIDGEQGHYGPALRRLDQALPVAVEVGPALVALVIQTRAWVTVQSGRFAEGLATFEEAAQAYKSASLPLGEHYIEYADALMELRLLPEALTAARRAVAEFSGAGVPLMSAEAQLRVAQLAVLTGDHAEATAAATAAVAAFRQQTRVAWRARAVIVAAEAHLSGGTGTDADLRKARAAARLLADMRITSASVRGFLATGRLAAQLGRRGQAISALGQASSLARGAPVLVRLRGHLAAALAAVLQRRDGAALAHCRRGLSDLARHRGSLPSVELRALASGHGTELGSIGMEVVVKEGAPARVLNWMERSRAAALLAVEPPAFGEISEDLSSLRAVHARQRDAAGPDDPWTARARPWLPMEQAAIEERIRRATWRARLASGMPSAPVTAIGLRDRLGERVLAAYGRLRDDLVAVVIERRRSRIVHIGPLRPVSEQLRALLFALRRLARLGSGGELAAARASADLRIRKLTELLVAPLALRGDAELVIIPPPGLDGIPWAALHGDPVCLAPSATFWARTADAANTQPPPGPGLRVALVAGPGLPGAIDEVESLARLYPAAARMMPPDSTAGAVADALAGADLAHLACHGILRADNPMFSSLVLSDGPMTVQELYTRGLAPPRLILASCESGSQASYAGDEVLGFVGALLARGTIGLLASAAIVPDVPAIGLMNAVHRQLAGGATLARALHEARQSQDTEDPGSFVNWCTFNAHGAA
ncbi:MAG TPA: CHAT domain-containing tetratricopeptide repeat protein [Streptosporangiaceae bacterium]|nr:CHAT domain-containing tetratricopeptide repeat protein [Streptosporangiaceae bacterium]